MNAVSIGEIAIQGFVGIATIAIAFLTFYIYKVAKDNLKTLNETAKKEQEVMTHRFMGYFNSKYFSTRTRLIFDLIEYDSDKDNANECCLLFRQKNDCTFFEIVFDKLSEPLQSDYRNALKSEYGYDKTVFTPSEVDDILGHFEDVGIYRLKKLLDDHSLYETYSYYIIKFHENSQIRQFIKHSRESDTREGITNNPDYKSDLYDQFEMVYKVCREQQRIKMQKR